MLVLAFLTAASATDVDAQVRIAVAGVDGWMPADFTAAMNELERIGPAAVPELARQVQATEDPHALFGLCEGLQRVGDPSALPALLPRLDDPRHLVRSSCGQAYAESLMGAEAKAIDPMRRMVRDDAECSVRVNVATAVGPVDDPALSAWFLATLDRTASECDTRTAMSGLATSPRATSQSATFIAHMMHPALSMQVRETGAWALTVSDHPEARPAFLRLLEGPDPGGNLRMFALRGLARVGTADDLPLLRRVVDTDPYQGEGVWAHEGRRAIQAIEGR